MRYAMFSGAASSHHTLVQSLRLPLGVALGLAAASHASAEVVGINYNGTITSNQLFELDLAAGTRSLLSTVQFDGNGYHGPSFIVDGVTRQAYAQATGGRIFATDLDTGSVTIFDAPEFQAMQPAGDGRLLALSFDDGRNMNVLSRYDPATEQTVELNAWQFDTQAWNADTFSYDSAAQTAYVVSSGGTLYALDIESSTIQTVSLDRNLARLGVASDGRLFGVNPSPNGMGLYAVNATTGLTTLLGEAPGGTAALYTFTLDPAGNRAFIRTVAGYFYFDLDTGEATEIPFTDMQRIAAEVPGVAAMLAESSGQFNVARAVSQIGGAGGDALALELNRLDPAQVPTVLQSLTPQHSEAISHASFAGSATLQSNVFARAAEHRTGMAAHSGGRFRLDDAGFDPGLRDEPPHSALYDSVLPPSPEALAADAGVDSSWSAFAIGSATLGDFETTPAATGYEFHTLGVTVGLDRRLTPEFVVGGFLGYSYGEADLAAGAGDSETQSIRAGAFASWSRDRWHADGLLAAGYHFYDLARHIEFGGVNETATASPDGQELSAAANVGYDLDLPHAWTLTPSAGLAYTYVWIDGYSESGAGVLNLDVDDQSAVSLQSRLGASVRRSFELSGFQVIPQLGIAWQHEFLDQARTGSARFAGSGGDAFSFETADTERDTLVLSAAATLLGDGAWSAFANYTAELNDDYAAHTVRAGVRVPF